MKLRDILAELRHPTLLLWALFVFSTPLYVVDSGLPQPGNVMLVLLIPVALARWDGRLAANPRMSVRALLWFVLWVIVVSTAWMAITGSFGFLVFPAYYIFNLLIFFAGMVLMRRHGDAFLRVTFYTIAASVLFQVFASFVITKNLYRDQLFFNNPNQLGYWALLAASATALLQRRLGTSRVFSSFVLTCAAYLAVSSASRAAVVGIAILLFLLVFSNPRVIIGMSIATAVLLWAGGPVSEALDSARDRAVTERDANQSFFEERGYDRLWNFKEYLLFGAGEGAVDRFAVLLKDKHEIHSSAATVLFSYGIVGAILFGLFVVRVCRGATLRAGVMLLPPLSYTIAHQGLRFSMLWVLLAVFAASKESRGPPGSP